MENESRSFPTIFTAHRPAKQLSERFSAVVYHAFNMGEGQAISPQTLAVNPSQVESLSFCNTSSTAIS